MLASLFFALPSDALLVRALLYTHIAAGFTALLSGLVPMLGRKGGPWHVRAGRLYTYCMLAVAATAVGLVLAQPITGGRLFLTGVAVLAFYLSYTGWRAAARRSPRLVGADKWLAIGSLLVAVAMIGAGVRFGSILFAFFGGLLAVFAGGDTRLAFAPPATAAPGARPVPWIFRHFTRMGGAYISTLTAFLVVNMGRWLPAGAPAWVGTAVWIAPSVVGGALIGRTVRAHKQRMKLG